MMCHEEQKKSGSRMSKFWIVQSTDDVVRTIERINAQRNAKDIATFDFITLCTKFMHKWLKEKLAWAVRRAYEHSKRVKIAVYNRSAGWVDKPKEGTIALTAEELIERIHYLVDNIFVEYNGVAIRQAIGIPMGTDRAPQLANLLLFVLEYEWVSEREKTDAGRRTLKELGYLTSLAIFTLGDRTVYL